MMTDVAQRIDDDQWYRTVAHHFSRKSWVCPRTGRTHVGIGGLRDQDLTINVFNHFHLTFCIGINCAGVMFKSPSDQSIMHLITFYGLSVFILFGAFHQRGPLRFIKEFKKVLKEERVGHIIVKFGWNRIWKIEECKAFIKMLEFQLAVDRNTAVIRFYTGFKTKLMER